MAQEKVAFGYDIGGTNTVFGFVNKEGKIIYESSIPTNSHEKAEILFERLFNEINSSF
jgi:glucokinase